MFPERVGSMTPCPSCTSIIDAIDRAVPHLLHVAYVEHFDRTPEGRGTDWGPSLSYAWSEPC
jgi:predicted dithiol-disulfide oxidoreductase (DUF899 family)